MRIAAKIPVLGPQLGLPGSCKQLRNVNVAVGGGGVRANNNTSALFELEIEPGLACHVSCQVRPPY